MKQNKQLSITQTWYWVQQKRERKRPQINLAAVEELTGRSNLTFGERVELCNYFIIEKKTQKTEINHK